jgi:hypothetical protein
MIPLEAIEEAHCCVIVAEHIDDSQYNAWMMARQPIVVAYLSSLIEQLFEPQEVMCDATSKT